jgi:hypothetical protein
MQPNRVITVFSAQIYAGLKGYFLVFAFILNYLGTSSIAMKRFERLLNLL